MHKMQVCILTGKSLWVNLPFFKRGSFSYFAYFCRFSNRTGGSGVDARHAGGSGVDAHHAGEFVHFSQPCR